MHIRLVAGSVIIDDDGFGTPGPPGWFIGIFVLFVLLAIGTAAYKAWWSGEVARKRGHDPGEARMASLLTGDLGTAATYLRPDAAASSPAESTPLGTVEDRLARLDDLVRRGLVTPDEAAERRAEILDDL